MKITETKLARIAQRSSEDPEAEFKWLMPHYNLESLARCFEQLDGKKAVGADKITKKQYGKELGKNLDILITKMKRMAYRPQPVKEVLIPKEGQKGKYRPLGISVFEDKIVQFQTSKILHAIYEPVFLDCSYGFRPGRNCHNAVKAVRNYIFSNNCRIVIDVDLKNFFGTIDHKILIDLLSRKIKDETFMRYIVRMLKAGILRDGELSMADEGSPQGNIASPVLANIYAHYVIDEWFEFTVKKHIQGYASLFRYADDIIICCEHVWDGERIRKALKKRLEKYGLCMNEDKTKMVNFSKWDYKDTNRSEEFDFLGFTFYLGKSRKGYTIPKVKTAKKRFRTKLKRVNEWCKKHRNAMKLKELWKIFVSKLRGHIQYYGISFNLYWVQKFIYRSVRYFFKWINRRSQRRSINWNKFNRFMKVNPLPMIRVIHSLL